LFISVESDTGEEFPGVDFAGTVEFQYIGLQFYLRGRF
jgi:hypothetical protein